MKLSVFKRTTAKKSEINKIRREGDIPAVIYGRNADGETIFVKGDAFRALLRNMQSGLLSTTVFELEDGHKTVKAIVKDIQYHVATYAVQHLDFILLSDEIPVTVKVPIRVLGLADCAGIKLGGFMRQAIRTLKVSCLPKDIPQEFSIDISKLNISESRRLSDIELPQGVKPVAKMNEVAIVIAKKAGG